MKQIQEYILSKHFSERVKERCPEFNNMRDLEFALDRAKVIKITENRTILHTPRRNHCPVIVSLNGNVMITVFPITETWVTELITLQGGLSKLHKWTHHTEQRIQKYKKGKK